LLSTLDVGVHGVITGVEDHSTAFLQYLDRMGLVLGAGIVVLERFEYDASLRILNDDGAERILSEKVTQNLYIKTNA
jgi:DtxR family Mn-dependent transcriptional regulator